MKSKKTPPKLRLLISSWTLRQYPSAKKEWSPKQKLRAIFGEGFDGVASGVSDPLMTLAHAQGAYVAGGTDISSIGEIEAKFKTIRQSGAVHINVQLCDHDTPTAKALPLAIAVIRAGERLGLKPAIEVHRDTCTETPEKAFALADAYQRRTGKKLRMNFDHSHPAIIKHLVPADYWKRLGVRLDLLRMSEMIHFRPFNGHHCQIPITDGKGNPSPEFKAWLPFCDKVVETWLQAAQSGRELVVVPELGPKVSGYGLSCFPDTWREVCVLGHEIRKIWNRHARRWRA